MSRRCSRTEWAGSKAAAVSLLYVLSVLCSWSDTYVCGIRLQKQDSLNLRKVFRGPNEQARKSSQVVSSKSVRSGLSSQTIVTLSVATVSMWPQSCIRGCSTAGKTQHAACSNFALLLCLLNIRSDIVFDR